MDTLEKREHVRPPLVVRPGGSLDGHTFHMARLAARDYVAMRRGELSEADLIGLALAAIVDSSLPEGVELDLEEALVLMQAWVTAHTGAAVPPA